MNLNINPSMNPNAIPERCAMFPVLSSGFPTKNPYAPMRSPATQSIPARKIGSGTPNVQTMSPGFRITNAPMIPKIAPLAPSDAL